MMKILLPAGWNQNRVMLVSANVLVALLVIALDHAGVLPLDPVNFVFFSFVLFLFSLYRPGWAFLFLVGLVPFETVNILPAEWGADLRPYQWLSAILFFAVIMRAAAGKLPFPLTRPRWFDWLLLLVPAGAFIAAAYAPDTGAVLKQALITLSFGIVYALARIFWQSVADIRQSIPFILGSGFVVSAYALWQNLRFLAGMESYEVMAGRPNATFPEADWLGLFTVVMVSILFALMYRLLSPEKRNSLMEYAENPKIWLVSAGLMTAFVVLIITVARSAWLGAVAASFVFIALVWRMSGWRKAAGISSIIGTSAAVALLAVFLFSLTPFDLSNRAGSTASGLQEITIACEQDSTLPVLPAKIRDTSELEAFRCRHIMLEEIASEEAAGRFVSTISRDDPNISIRKDIYAKVRDTIAEHPIAGIGWGSIASILGTDERGAGLNASNAFLEVWLGSGLIGFIAFSVFWFGIAIAALARMLSDGSTAIRETSLFILSAWAGITIFDLFNSGILLGFMFLYLALGALVLQQKKQEVCH